MNNKLQKIQNKFMLSILTDRQRIIKLKKIHRDIRNMKDYDPYRNYAFSLYGQPWILPSLLNHRNPFEEDNQNKNYTKWFKNKFTKHEA